MNRIAAVVAGLLLAFVGTANSQAADVTLQPGDSIQDAINSASPGDIITLDSGTFHQGNINTNGQAITIQGTVIDGNLKTIINAHQAGSVFTFQTSETSGTVIKDLVITEGVALNGGGIICIESSPTISGCTITGNTANYNGGGIYCLDNSHPAITGCTITGNTTEYGNGGGISCFGSPTITNCTISGNTAINKGGGINCEDGADPTITNSNITGNTAWLGGGIYCDSSNPTISGGSICGNHPDQHYGCHPWSAPGTTIAPTCPKPPGDMDGDGDVDADDVHLVEHEAGICHHDTNGDGITNIIDVLEVIIGWGASCAP